MRAIPRAFILAALLIITLGYKGVLVAQEPSYIGASSCGMCHKSEKQGNQFETWQNSLHAKASEVLLTPEAEAIAKEKGLAKKASEAAECLKCHASGWDVDKARLGKSFKVEDGVQCETCHGPGSEYKTLKVMKDHGLAVEKGLKVHDNIEEYCKTCHNQESPTFAGFKFVEAWAKIEHPVPGK